MTNLVSIILPAFNAEKYISPAITSMLNQTHTEIELIVIDDGSTDNTLKIAKQFTDRRIRIIENGKNCGIVRTLNTGIDSAKGAFIARMDADDISFPERIENQLKTLRDRKLDLISSSAKTSNKIIKKTIGLELNSDEIRLCCLFFNPVIHPLILGRTEFFKNNPYSINYEYAEDYELWTRLLASGTKFETTRDVLLHYRLHKGQTSQTKKNQQIKTRDKIAKIYLSKFQKEEAETSTTLQTIKDVVNREIINKAKIGEPTLDRLAIELLLESKISENQLHTFYNYFDAKPPAKLKFAAVGLSSKYNILRSLCWRITNRIFR